MKIAIVSAVSPLPADAGNRVRIEALCRAIEGLGHELHFIHIPRHGDSSADRAGLEARFGAHLHWLTPERPVGGAARQFLNDLMRFGRWVRRPLSGWPARRERLDDRFDARLLPRLQAIAERERFDAVCVEYVFSSRALEAFDRPTVRVVDTHDVFALRNELLRRQGTRARWYSCSVADEDRGLRRADVVLAIQPEDGLAFADRLGPQGPRVVTLSHLITPYRLELSHKPAACFFAHRSPLNVEACRWFIGEVMPAIRAVRPDFRLHVAGAVCELIEATAGVVKHGTLASLAPLFEAAPLLVNPSRTGTGIGIKMLDAMAAGVPVVSTATSARGFAADQTGGMRIVADGDAEGFAAAVLGFIDDPVAWSRARAAQAEAADGWAAQQKDVLRGLFPATP